MFVDFGSLLFRILHHEVVAAVLSSVHLPDGSSGSGIILRSGLRSLIVSGAQCGKLELLTLSVFLSVCRSVCIYVCSSVRRWLMT